MLGIITPNVIQIKLECIGEDSRAIMKLWRGILNSAISSGAGDAIIGHVPNRAWCAEIIGLHPRFGFERRFLHPAVDYLYANSMGSRGVYAYYNLEEKHVYDISEPTSWKRTDRYFARVERERLIRMTKEEVRTWLSARSAQTY